jgi:hypothetical protein
MAMVLYPWQILVAAMAGWITRQQDAVIDYLREENRVLKEQFGRTTISNIFNENEIDPAPERGKRTTWSQFLKAHWSVLAAADFFTVEIWGPRGLVTFYVFFVIELATRRVEIAGITPRSVLLLDRPVFTRHLDSKS